MPAASPDQPDAPVAIHIDVPPRLLLLPGGALFLGSLIGFVRGSRAASLRFLAENVHRPPTTVRGWYFYNKTKNYRVLLGGLQAGGVDALRLGSTALGWVLVEEGMRRAGPPWDALSNVGAGVGTAGVYSAVYRLPWKAARRTLGLGLGMGVLVEALAWSQTRLSALRESVEGSRDGLDGGDVVEKKP